MTYGQAVKALADACKSSKDASVLAALDTIASGRLRISAANPILVTLTAGGIGSTVHEDDIYKKYHSGRKDTYWIIADAIKLASDKNTRQWVDFSVTTGLYTYKGTGPVPPKGYTGYVPKIERK